MGGYSEYSEQIEITIDDHKSPSETLCIQDMPL